MIYVNEKTLLQSLFYLSFLIQHKNAVAKIMH